jgi:glycine oxidase
MLDVIVVGGGIVGLATAFRLAQSGQRVAVVERDRITRAASRAAAAMIAPVGYVEPAGDAFLRLRLDGAGCWPAFASSLTEMTGVDPRYQVTGSLVVAMAAGDLDGLSTLHAFHEELGIPSRLLDPAAARAVEPRLAETVYGALHVPGEGCVDPERTGQALKMAITGLGGEVREGVEVTALRTVAGRVVGIDTTTGPLDAPLVVNAAGAWSALLPGLPDEARPPLRPVKGQSVIIRAPLDIVIRAGAGLVPRGDGRVMVAGTVEHGAGHDSEPTVAGVLDVLGEARRAMPALAAASIVAVAVGVRPVGDDDAPILGPSSIVDGLWWATGHSYYGILLAPITAELLAGAITGDAAAQSRVRAFGADRFTTGRPRYTSLRP